MIESDRENVFQRQVLSVKVNSPYDFRVTGLKVKVSNKFNQDKLEGRSCNGSWIYICKSSA